MEENKAKIRTFLSQFFRAQSLNDKEDIFALGLNSLFAMQLVMWIEKEFGIGVEDEDLDIQNFNSINAIVGFIKRKTSVGVGA